MFKLTLSCFPVVVFAVAEPTRWEAKLILTILDPLGPNDTPVEFDRLFIGKTRREASDLAMAFVVEQLKHL